MRKKLSAFGQKLNGIKDAASSKVASLKETVTNWFDGQAALTSLFAGSIVSANLLASKIAMFDVPFYGTAIVPAGFLALGAGFLFTDTLSELYGPEAAHKAVNGTVLAVLLSLGLVKASVAMPSAAFYQMGEEYASILSASTSISLASVATILVSQNLDVSIFHKLHESGLPKWVRNIGSTVASQFVDTALFITLAFALLPRVFDGTATPLTALPALIASQYIVKVAVALLDTPFFYALTMGSEE